MSDTALLSVLIVAPSGARSIAYVMDRLAQQTHADRIEIVIATPAAHVPEHDWPGHPARTVRAVPVQLTSTAGARAQAIPECSAPIISFLEDHSFPTRPDWAEQVIAAFAGTDHAAIGPAMHCANPCTATSWANLYVDYGHWMHPAEPRLSGTLPGHNSSYRASALADIGPGLADLLEAENMLHHHLTAAGHSLLLQPKIKVSHINYSRLSQSIPMQFRNGQMFAASRSRHWALPRRLLYTAAAPAIAALRIGRFWRQIRRGPDRPRSLRTLPSAVCLFGASAAGEALGYLRGETVARQRMADYELHRWPRLTPGDQARFALTTGNLPPTYLQSTPS